MRATWQRIGWIFFCLALALITVKSFHRHQNWVDATAFICGAQTVREHENPYLVEPLYSCEVSRFREIHHPEWSSIVTPSPLPLYAYLPFIPISFLPQKIALAVWYALLVGSVAISCVLLQRITGYSLQIIFLALFMPCIFLSFALGQIVPFIVCMIVAAIWFQRRRQILLASLCAIGTMIEPNIGLPVCLALFSVERNSRVPLVCGAVVLGLSCLLLGPLQENIQYFREVLPAHAATEVHNDEQLSFTHIAWLFGAPERLALSLGSLSYLISLIAGCIVAILLSRVDRLRDIALIVAPSFALIGGTYSHIQQFSIFTVLALLISTRSPKDSPKHKMSVEFAACAAIVLFDLPLIVSNVQVDVYMYVGLTVLLTHFVLRFKPLYVLVSSTVVGIVTFAISRFRRMHDLTPTYAAAFQHRLDVVTAHAHFADDVWLVNMNDIAYQFFGKLALLIDAPLYLAIALTLYALARAYMNESHRNAVTSEA